MLSLEISFYSFYDLFIVIVTDGNVTRSDVNDPFYYCLSQRITPASLRLRSNIRTERGIKIIQRAEKQLMDERVRSINTAIDVCRNLIDTCKMNLKELLTKNYLKNAMNLSRRSGNAGTKLFWRGN